MYTKNNERHTTHGHNLTHESSEKKCLEVRFLAVFSYISGVGLTLGCELRWFHLVIFTCFSTRRNLVNR